MIKQKYPWCEISPTVHKLLIHSVEISRSLPLPLGVFGEEGAESRNKYTKSDRYDFARRTSRLDNFTDVFNRGLDSTDPFIVSLYKSKKTKISSSLSTEVSQFLILEDDEYESNASQMDIIFEEIGDLDLEN